MNYKFFDYKGVIKSKGFVSDLFGTQHLVFIALSSKMEIMCFISSLSPLNSMPSLIFVSNLIFFSYIMLSKTATDI